MIVHAYGGLCNRLRVILSYRAVHGEIGVVWLADEEIAGARFLDVFEPIAGVQWMADNCRADVRTLAANRAVPLGSEVAYRELRPLRRDPYEWRAAIGPYDAIHVRRTDHVGLARAAGAFTDDAQFEAWIQRPSADRPVFIATDNADSLERFTRVVSASHRTPVAFGSIVRGPQQRHTSLGHAVADLFLCAGASDFMGSGESSFSATIQMMRRLGGWWT